MRGPCGPCAGVGSPNWAGEGALGNTLAASVATEIKPCTPQKTRNTVPSTTRGFWKPFADRTGSERVNSRSADLDKGAIGFKLNRQKWAPARAFAALVQGPGTPGPEMPSVAPGWTQPRPGRHPPWAS